MESVQSHRGLIGQHAAWLVALDEAPVRLRSLLSRVGLEDPLRLRTLFPGARVETTEARRLLMLAGVDARDHGLDALSSSLVDLVQVARRVSQAYVEMVGARSGPSLYAALEEDRVARTARKRHLEARGVEASAAPAPRGGVTRRVRRRAAAGNEEERAVAEKDERRRWVLEAIQILRGTDYPIRSAPP